MPQFNLFARSVRLIMIISLLLSMSVVFAVDIPNEFSPGAEAKASEVNANFNALEMAVDDLEGNLGDIAGLLELIVTEVEELPPDFPENPTLADVIELLIGAIFEQSSRIEELEGKFDGFGNLFDHLYFDDVDSVVIDSANLRIINGSGATYDASNGVGNLIIGYDADPMNGGVCSDGIQQDETACLTAAIAGTWITTNLKNGSHNLVIGDGHVYKNAIGGIVVGQEHYITGRGSGIIAGTNNATIESSAGVFGGLKNVATDFSSVFGGQKNVADGLYSVAIGGDSNMVDAKSVVVMGGFNNASDVNFGTIIGGYAETQAGPTSEYGVQLPIEQIFGDAPPPP